MSIRKVPFGTLESGEAADLYILTNASGASVEITNFGGIIHAINVPDREGKLGNVVLGYKDVSGYQPLCGYLGALIGRVGNRIANGECTVSGQKLTLAKNENGITHLHGGDVGFDRSLIAAYGHDDRVCAYASLEAILTLPAVPRYTCCCLLADKEEIGSVGATGMRAHYFENAMAELIALTTPAYSELTLRRALRACRMLSCDVSAGFDPLYASAFEKKNAALMGHGVCYNKFTGSRGKSGSNDANAEFIGRLRKIMDDNNVTWQTAELGRVDVGGGGTIAYICALYGMEVIDSGVPVLSMHAPQEIINKADLFEAVKAYRAFMIEG